MVQEGVLVKPFVPDLKNFAAPRCGEGRNSGLTQPSVVTSHQRKMRPSDRGQRQKQRVALPRHAVGFAGLGGARLHQEEQDALLLRPWVFG
jgi:hypothetical protein